MAIYFCDKILCDFSVARFIHTFISDINKWKNLKSYLQMTMIIANCVA